MTSYNGTLVSHTNHGHPPKSSLIAAGLLAVCVVGVLSLAEFLPTLQQAELALPPVQATAVLGGDLSLPVAATVFNGREVRIEESAPTI